MDIQQEKIDELFRRGILEKSADIKKEFLISDPEEIKKWLGKQIKSISIQTIYNDPRGYGLLLYIRDYDKYINEQSVYLDDKGEGRELLHYLLNYADYRSIFIYRENITISLYYNRFTKSTRGLKEFVNSWLYVIIYILLFLYYVYI